MQMTRHLTLQQGNNALYKSINMKTAVITDQWKISWHWITERDS